MTLYNDNILIKDYMNLVLVANDLKPATETGFQKSYGHNHCIPRLISIEDERRDYIPKKVKRLHDHKIVIEQFPLLYITQFFENSIDCDFLGCNETYFNEGVQFYVAKDDYLLHKLLNAKSDREKGEAYGFPKEAIEFFANPLRKGCGAAAEMYRNIEYAIENGIPIPSWLAYISHVPEKTDFINNDVSESSRDLGQKYQSFIKQNHPDLAKMVEENFITRLPSKIYIDPKGNICSVYKFTGTNRKNITLTL